MLSGISASLSVTSLSSLTGLGGDIVTVGHQGGEVWCCCDRTRGVHSFFSLVFDVPKPPMLRGCKSLLSEQENEYVPVARASGFPALDIWLMPQLGSIGEADFKTNFAPFLRPKA